MTLDLMTTAQVAEKTHVDPSTVTRWAKDKKLVPAFKTSGLRGGYLFHPKDVDAFIASGQHKQK